MKWTRQRWWPLPCRVRAMAATRPACWSEMTSCTPDRPRFFNPVRNARQNTSSSLSPTSRPRISRRPCSVTPVATTTALDTTMAVLGAHVQVGRVQVHVREGGVVQAAGAERPDALVQPGADPARPRSWRSPTRPAPTTRSSTLRVDTPWT